MKKFLTASILILTISFSELLLVDKFPIWLKDGHVRADQTSGITFIGSKNGYKFFLICDDIGKIHRMGIKNNQLKIETLKFDKSVEKTLMNFVKKDFEEIVYDKFTGDVYLSIEGNGLNYRDETGIYKLKFKNNDIFSDIIVDVEKIKFGSWEHILNFTAPNIAFEGAAVSNTKIFLGLEGFQFGDLFLDSTLIFIFDKNSKKLIKQISTKDLKIHTITGLYAYDDYSIFGIDRNRQNFFEIKFDRNYNVESVKIIKLELPVPGRRDLKYTAAIEGVTLDDENYVYIVDDPWKKFYIPPSEILSKLTETDKENFKSFIPLLFKYKLNWEVKNGKYNKLHKHK